MEKSMAPKIFSEIAISLILLLVVQQNIEATTKHDISNLLSLLTNKLHGQKQPIIVIFDKNLGTAPKNKNLGLNFSPETSDEGAFHLVHNLIGHDKFKTKKRPQPKKSTPKPFPRVEKKKQRFRSQKHLEDRSLQKEDSNVLRSPIVKKLLRISNSLRCEAKDECQDKCSNKFYGKKVINCQIQCEVKYVCEVEEEKDHCDDDPCADSCDRSAECQGAMSTKGEKLVTEEPGCVRC